MIKIHLFKSKKEILNTLNVFKQLKVFFKVKGVPKKMSIKDFLVFFIAVQSILKPVC